MRLPKLSGSCAGGFEFALAATKITYCPWTCHTMSAAGKETAQTEVVQKQFQGFEALKGG